MSDYPTWVFVDQAWFETEEQRDGVPDYILTREHDGWRLQARLYPRALRGFPTPAEAFNFVEDSLGGPK